MQKTGITGEAFSNAAKLIGCDIATIKAVRQVEAPRGPFDDRGRLTILFEPYIFYKGLKKAERSPDRLLNNPLYKNAKIISPVFNPKLYGAYSEQYQKLTIAKAIDPVIAMESTSWGSFQIMGFNHTAAGYSDVMAMVAAMSESEEEHLKAFVRYIKANHLDDELRAHDWVSFARQYNGPLYWKNKYDSHLKDAFKSFS